ncbi:MAG: hypothetical protein KKA84_16395 [Bacteroidetes bacterium]|nr:hypothetical protein [Bacteroidota bacterium]
MALVILFATANGFRIFFSGNLCGTCHPELDSGSSFQNIDSGMRRNDSLICHPYNFVMLNSFQHLLLREIELFHLQ